MNERKRFVAFLVALHGLVETVDAAPVRGQDIRGCEPSAAAAHASGLQSARDRRKGPTAVGAREAIRESPDGHRYHFWKVIG